VQEQACAPTVRLETIPQPTVSAPFVKRPITSRRVQWRRWQSDGSSLRSLFVQQTCVVCEARWMQRHGVLLVAQRASLVDLTDGALQGCRHARPARRAAQTPAPPLSVRLTLIPSARSTPGTMATGPQPRVPYVRQGITLSQVSSLCEHTSDHEAMGGGYALIGEHRESEVSTHAAKTRPH
jgi:hypothetical protein